MTTRRWVGAALAAAALAVPQAAGAAVGDPDPTFNNGEPVTLRVPGNETAFISQNDLADAVTDGNNRTTAASNAFQRQSPQQPPERFGLLQRIGPDGALDATFGSGGSLRAPGYGANLADAQTAADVFLDPAGRLLSSWTGPNGSVTARHLASGALDTDFDEDGVAGPTPQGWLPIASGAGADGASYFVSYDTIYNTGAERGLRVERYDATGARDARWGETVSIVVRERFQQPTYAVAAGDSQGRLYLARSVALSGGPRDVVDVMRFAADGTVDTSWGRSGHYYFGASTTTGNLRPTSIAVATDGSVFVAGEDPTDQKGFLALIGPSGFLDNTFGVRYTDTALTKPEVIVGPDGNPIFAGTRRVQEDEDAFSTAIELYRYTRAGVLDPTFSGDGYTRDLLPSYGEGRVQALSITPSGNLVVAGTYDPGQQTKGFVGRYLLRDPSLGPELLRGPVLRGTPKLTGELTCERGRWSNSPDVEVVWERAPRNTTSDTDPAWASIAAGTDRYVVTQEDIGSRLRCREAATNVVGSASAPSSSLRADAGVPAMAVPPVVAGVPVVGERLTCQAAQWSNGPDLNVQWLRAGVPIAGATGRGYVVRQEDRRSRIACQETAANDVGPAASAARSGNDLLAVGAPPANLAAPSIATATTGARATDKRLTCGTGRWDEDYESYEYRWEREGAEIAGATGSFYDATPADLGRLINCIAFSTNPAGRSQGARSERTLVPLPATGEPAAIAPAGGYNRLDPLNMMALTRAWRSKLDGLALARRQAAIAAARAACDQSAPLPDFSSYMGKAKGTYLGARQTCGVLVKAPPSQVVTTIGSGISWIGDGSCRLAGVTQGTGTPCPALRITTPPLNPYTPPAGISQLEQSTLAEAAPVAVLWDVDNDGRTDATCDGSAPILRTLPSQGIYDVRAVVVTADSAQTGVYSVGALRYAFFPDNGGQKGQLRDAQPFACKTVLSPPPDPELPCVNSTNIGRTIIKGNICPVSARRIPDADLGGLPPDVRTMLRAQAFAAPLRRPLGATARLPMDAPVGLKAAPGSLPYVATAQADALSALGTLPPAEVPKDWEDQLKKQLPDFKVPEAQYAMDQVMLIRGQAKVNGVDVNPRNGAMTVVVPSDAGKAIDSVTRMTLSNRNAQLELGGVPIGPPEAMSKDLQDKVRERAKSEAEALLKQANFDQLAKDLAKKLDLGPFKLAGDAKVKLQPDGTALIEAQAQLKGAFKTGSGPIRTDVKINATREGKLSLVGIRMKVPKALLGAVNVKDLDVGYDPTGGLNLQGQLLFPPVNDGVAINRFRTTPDGEFRELDVSYLAGTGQGVKVGPGIFLVKLGGGLSLNPDEIRARAGLSIGPSAGGGCPTAGLDADMTVRFGPPPFYFKTKAALEVICIPLADATFYADSTGMVELGAAIRMSMGLIYFNVTAGAIMKLPSWQIFAKGEGGIRYLLSGTVKVLLSNLGIAACGRVEIFPETPFTDAVTIAGGAGARFSNGKGPFSFSEMVNNLSLFTGCSLTKFSPFGRETASAAQTGGARSFDLPKDAPAVQALELTGVGGSPKVKLTKPDGTVLDASKIAEELTKGDEVSGLRDEARSRTVLFVRGAPGTWRVEPVPGSPAIADLRQAEVLPDPKVSAKVGGAGAQRLLRYRVAKLPGQVVRFVEQSEKGQRAIATVRGGGRGTVRFLTSEGAGTKRTVLAQVTQDGMPRDTLTVARFSAPNPRVAKPRVTVRRKGSKVTVSWRKAFYAKAYEVSVRTGRGRSFMVDPAGKRSVRFGRLAKGEGATVRVVGLSPGGRRGPAGTARVKGSLRVRTGAKRDRWDRAKAKARKRKGRGRVRGTRGLSA